MLKNNFKKENKNSSLKIVHSQTIDGIFCYYRGWCRGKVFWNKVGEKWIDIYTDIEDYKALESLIV